MFAQTRERPRRRALGHPPSYLSRANALSSITLDVSNPKSRISFFASPRTLNPVFPRVESRIHRLNRLVSPAVCIRPNTTNFSLRSSFAAAICTNDVLASPDPFLNDTFHSMSKPQSLPRAHPVPSPSPNASIRANASSNASAVLATTISPSYVKSSNVFARASGAPTAGVDVGASFFVGWSLRARAFSHRRSRGVDERARRARARASDGRHADLARLSRRASLAPERPASRRRAMG